jgi:hypothetical protein
MPDGIPATAGFIHSQRGHIMNANIIRTALVLACIAIPVAALASTYDGECTDKPQSEWLSTAAVKERFQVRGYTVGKVKSHGSCYEVYTRDESGKKIEFFVNPTDASVVAEAGKK